MKLKNYILEESFNAETEANKIFEEIRKASGPIIEKHRKGLQDKMLSSKIPEVFQELGKQMFHFWKGFTGKDAWRKFK